MAIVVDEVVTVVDAVVFVGVIGIDVVVGDVVTVVVVVVVWFVVAGVETVVVEVELVVVVFVLSVVSVIGAEVEVDAGEDEASDVGLGSVLAWPVTFRATTNKTVRLNKWLSFMMESKPSVSLKNLE